MTIQTILQQNAKLMKDKYNEISLKLIIMSWTPKKKSIVSFD